MKTGRNAPCPCGSGKKFKHCCANVSRRAPMRQRVMLGVAGVLLALGAIAMAVAIANQTGQGSGKTKRVWSEEHQHWHEE